MITTAEFNQKTINDYFNILEETPLPSAMQLPYDLDYWAYLEDLYNNVSLLKLNRLLALTCTPYLQGNQASYLWTFIFDASRFDQNAIIQWLDDNGYYPSFTKQDNIVIVTINAI